MKNLPFFVSFFILSLVTPSIFAGVGSATVCETVEIVSKKFGKEVAEEGAENITKRLTTLTAKYGDDVCKGIQKVGPKTGLRILEEAGENADIVASLLAKRGTEAVWVVAKPDRLAVFVKYGDDAAKAMIKHHDVALPMISKFGEPAARSLNQLSTRGGRQLAMLEESGNLAKIGRTSELLSVIEKYGDRGMDFIWRNKGALLVGTTLTAFLIEPEPFINGTKDLVVPVTTSVVKTVGLPLAILCILYFMAKIWWR